MQITHFSNSFILIETNNLKICCDPWVGRANYGGWHSFPEFDLNELISKLQDVDIVYISHIHDDHLDTQFLIKSGLIKKKFVIKKFIYKTLFNRLKSIGVERVFELDPYEKFVVDRVSMSILPQITSNSSEIDEDVEYDIDTSIIISDGTTVFFNQVDNPYSSHDYNKLYEWIDCNYGKITIAALMAGAASEYPHNFLTIDKAAEKKKIVINVLNKLVEKLNILKPKFYFPAGGTYFIPGKMNVLNSLIAQPTLIEIRETLINNKINVNLLDLEGGKSILFINNSFYLENNINPISNRLENSIHNHKNDLYDYEIENINIDFEIIRKIFDLAKINWLEVINDKKIQIEQDVKFQIYTNLNIDKSLSKVIDNQIGQIELKSNLLEKKGDLIVHIDIRAMYLCLIRKKVWNGTIGALCLFERYPNVFYPSVTFSLNYLILKSDQLKLLGNIKY